ncbi:hypothetical protein F4781DRAFT_263282 [Annulohypoxylon bovei var. microspora]|nr:hypothetical protein F4781DRAFT_263282 [Annulohypoxylon bovei var. microspora]
MGEEREMIISSPSANIRSCVKWAAYVHWSGYHTYISGSRLNYPIHREVGPRAGYGIGIGIASAWKSTMGGVETLKQLVITGNMHRINLQSLPYWGRLVSQSTNQSEYIINVSRIVNVLGMQNSPKISFSRKKASFRPSLLLTLMIGSPAVMYWASPWFITQKIPPINPCPSASLHIVSRTPDHGFADCRKKKPACVNVGIF